MIIKNSFSILASEFRLVFKVLIYFSLMLLVFFAIFIGLAGPAFGPLKSVLSQASVIEDLREATEAFSRGGGFAPFIDTLIASLATGKAVISANSGSLMGPIFLAVVALFVCKFLFSLVTLPSAEVLMQAMSTGAHASLLPSFVTYIKKSLLYSLIYSLIALPLDLGIIVISILITKLYSILNLFALTLAVGFGFFAFSCRIALFSMWVPSIVVGEMSVIDAFKNNFKLLRSAFPSALSCSFIISLSVWCMSVTFGVITFGIATLILFPLGICFTMCVQMVLYYNLTGKKYYTDPVTIIDRSIDLIDKK